LGIGHAGYYLCLWAIQIRDVLRKFSFVEMSGWVGALEKKGKKIPGRRGVYE